MISNGIDLGDRSLAVASVELDDEGIPLRLRALSLLLHDGGVIDEQYKVSRIAKRGQARRTRRRFHRNRKRPNDVRAALADAGFPAPATNELPPHPSGATAKTLAHSAVSDRLRDGQFPHFARRALLEKIDDTDTAKLLFSCAVLHIDRHRGWRNPWQSIDSMLRALRDDRGELTMTPSANRWLRAVSERFEQEVRTYGEAAALAIERGQTVRPNKRILKSLGTDISKANSDIKRAKGPEDLAKLTSRFVLPIRPFQHDLAVELLLICKIQGFDPTAVEQIVKTVFWQEKPGFAVDVIGDCPLITDPPAKRAAAYLPSVQEWKIRGFVANLRITQDCDGGKTRRPSPEEAELLVQRLQAVKERNKVRWGSLEDWLTELTGELVKVNRNKREQDGEPSASEDADESSIETSRHPIIDTTYALILKDGSKWKSLKTWWLEADAEDRESLLRSLDPASHTEETDRFRDELLESGAIDAEDFEEFVERLPDGRVAYSAAAIDAMLPAMRDGMDLYEARKEAFGLDETWSPPGVKWDAPRMNHPVLQVVRSALNKSLAAIDSEIGSADFVRVEAARRSMSIKYEKRQMSGFAKENEARNIAARTNIEDNGENPGRGRVRTARIIADQNCQCAYGIACGGNMTLSLDNTELDHIIPRSEGAGNPRKNMVAVCRDCNQKKGGRTFASVATDAQLEAAVDRMKTWKLETFSPDLPREMERMLRAKSASDVDLRSPTPTSQVATQMCNMLRDRYATLGNDTTCESVNAAVGAEARKSAGFRKTRTDHRHHLVDAVVTATINPKVIPFLRERQARRDFARTFAKTSGLRDRLKAETDAYGLENDYFNRWMAGLTSLINDMHRLLELDGEPAVPNGDGPADPIAGLDAVVPRRPVRLKALSRNGDGVLTAADPLHEQTAAPLHFKRLGDSWTKDEIYRVADRDLHVHLRRALREVKKQLPEDEERAAIAGDVEVGPDFEVALTPRVPQVVVRGAAYAIGSVHHLRIYEFDDGSGPRRAFLPVYRYDVVQALREETDPRADRRATHVRLHEGAVSWRNAVTGNGVAFLRAMDNSQSARHVGWLMRGDEIFVTEPNLVREAKNGSAPAEWLAQRRYYCTGFEQKDINVRPLVIAGDGAESYSAVTLRISLAKGMDGILVVRRDSLGRAKSVWKPMI